MVPRAGAHPPPPRRDPVQARLEEPVVHDVLTHALRELRLADGQPLRVLDIGSGTGEGLALLQGAHGGSAAVTAAVTAECQFSYLGVDADPAAVAAARFAHPDGTFEVVDIRDGPPDGRFDLYLSCAASCSRLKAEELHEVLVALFDKVVRERHRAVFLVDVLGRYSIEWPARWSETRWNYAGALSADEGPTSGENAASGENAVSGEKTASGEGELMTFFDRRSLGAVIEAATDAAGVPAAVTFTDRSVLAGRHTTTRTFNPDIPPYRTLLNELARGYARVRPDELLFDPPERGAPDDVLAFFRDWAREWNDVVREFGDPNAIVEGERAERLATRLLEHERHHQRGLGAGHSLTATVVLDAT